MFKSHLGVVVPRPTYPTLLLYMSLPEAYQ
jgi:hypothetical protein